MRTRLLWLVLSVGVILAAGSIASTGSAGAATSTTTALTASPNPASTGVQVTYTATISPIPDGGSVEFKGGSAAIPMCGGVAVNASTGIAICRRTYALPETLVVSATYSGDKNFASSTSATLEEAVSLPGTSTVVTSSANPSSEGQQVTYTATITPTPDAGTVTFTEGSATISGCSAVSIKMGQAACQQTYPTTGSHMITAAYAGDASFSASKSAAFNETIGLPATATALASSSNPSATGEQVTYTATVSPDPGGGTVAFTDGGAAISGCATVSAATGKATCQQTYTSTGSHVIVAGYSGDAGFAPSQSTALNQVVNLPSTKTSLTASESSSVAGQVTYTATVTPAPNGGTVAFTNEGATIKACGAVSVSASTGKASCQQTYSGSEPHTIAASYSGNASYAASHSEGLRVEIASEAALPATAAITKFKATGHTASFSFSAAGATGFECELISPAQRSKGSFAACHSPQTYKHVKAGTYTFRVRGVNKTGVARTPSSRKFKIA